MKVLPEGLFGAPTIECSSARIPELNGPIEVTHHDGLRGKLQQVCTLPQYLLHPLSFGDIDERSDRAPHVAGVIEKWIRAHQSLNDISARGGDFELDSPPRPTRGGGPLEWKLVKRKLHPILV